MADIDGRGRYKLTETGQAVQHFVIILSSSRDLKGYGVYTQTGDAGAFAGISAVVGDHAFFERERTVGGQHVFNREQNDLHLTCGHRGWCWAVSVFIM